MGGRKADKGDRRIVARYFILSLAFGIAMGLVFPVYAGLFASFETKAAETIFTLGCVVAGIIVGLASFLIGRVTVLSVIRGVAQRLGELCEAEGDLTKGLGIVSGDCIGELAGNFDGFLAKLRGMVLGFSAMAEGAGSVGRDLAENSTRSSASSEAISRNMDRIDAKTKTLIAELDNVDAARERIDDDAKVVGDSIDRQSDSLDRLSGLVEGTVERLREIADLTRSQTSAIALSIDHSKRNLEAFTKVAENIRDVDAGIADIGDLSKAIKDIAERIGILGINASIQSARAGEAGKGFSVVAQEVGKLSRSAGEDSARIDEGLGRITGLVRAGIGLSEATGRSLADLLEEIGSSAEAIAVIAERFEHVIAAAESMIGARDELVKATTEVAASMASMKGSTLVIGESMSVLMRTAGEYGGAMGDVTRGIREIAADVARIHEASSANVAGVESLKSELSKFKT